jgi:predicted nucleotidyltransferase
MAATAVRRRKTISDRYREAAERFAAAVRERFGDQIRAVVLYGSVARGEARRDSDIDLLVMVDRYDDLLRRDIVGLAYDLDGNRDFDTLTMPLVRSAEQIHRWEKSHSFLWEDIVTQGVILYGEGTDFQKCRIASSAG